ncbi:MAG: hypothetical protein A3H91_05245 [Gammaproteobacteria bacterium RIFCSPLOWO2_02_FULL_61_13]|nr:MAG: hypothetical protein A3H91_05245 [Gammaproteobacteria bacterium RIFCSPLOWO2_02_FULL_61_13]
MLAFLRLDDIDLTTTRGKRACVFATHTEQNKFSYIAEIESNTPAIRAAILAYFVPNDIALVLETPCPQHFNAFWK